MTGVVFVNVEGHKFAQDCRLSRMLAFFCRPLIFMLLKLVPSVAIVANVDITGYHDTVVYLDDKTEGHFYNSNISLMKIGGDT